MSKFYELIQWSSARAIADLGKCQVGIANVCAWALEKVDSKQLEHEVAKIEQQEIIEELKLLEATLKVKAHAVANGGFGLRHGPALEMCADALFNHFDWEDDDIAHWFGALVLNDDGSTDVDIIIDPDGEG